MMLTCALFSAGCGATGRATDGTGYAKLTPAAETRRFILANDRPFAQAVAAHNRQCGKDKGCRK